MEKSNGSTPQGLVGRYILPQLLNSTRSTLAQMMALSIAVDEKGKKLKWSYPVGAPVRSSPALGGNVVYFGSDDGFVYAWTRATANSSGNTRRTARWSSSPALAYGSLFVGSDDGYVYKLEDGKKGGQAQVEIQDRGPVRSSPALAGHVCILCLPRWFLYGMKEHKQGKALFKYALGGQPDSSPALAANKLYIGGDKLICFKK